MTPLSWILFMLLYIELDHALGEVISKMKAVSINIYIHVYIILITILIFQKKKLRVILMIRYIWKFYSVFVVVYDDRAFVENSCWKCMFCFLKISFICVTCTMRMLCLDLSNASSCLYLFLFLKGEGEKFTSSFSRHKTSWWHTEPMHPLDESILALNDSLSLSPWWPW